MKKQPGFILLLIVFACFITSCAVFAQSQGASYIETGKEMLGQHKFEEALAQFNKAVAENPQNVEAIFLKGTALYWLKRYPEADKAFDDASKLNNQHYLIWYFKGKSANAQGNSKDALAYYEKSIECNGLFKDAWFDKGLILYSKEEYHSAASCMGRVIHLDNTDGRAYCIAGMCHYWLGDMEQARDYITKGLSLNPGWKDNIPEKIRKAVGL
ncbi:MAG: tetratricopeptide repeat protein [Firmicutes bacterium]|nr:tetratricopeptide repeat protein [Bacillota bacterium]